MDHAGATGEKQTTEMKIMKLWKDCAQVLLQCIPHPTSKLNPTKPPKDAQWERKRGTCTANRHGLKATRRRWPRGLVRAGACSGSPSKTHGAPWTWLCLKAGWATGTSGDRGHSSCSEKHTDRWGGRAGRAGSTHHAHRKPADGPARQQGLSYRHGILPHSSHSPVFPAKTA